MNRFRYEKRSDQLEFMCRACGDQFESLLTDKTSIASYLKKQLELRNEQVFDLNDRLIGLQQAKDQQKDLRDKLLENSKDKCRSETERLENENLFLCKKELLLQSSNDVLDG